MRVSSSSTGVASCRGDTFYDFLLPPHVYAGVELEEVLEVQGLQLAQAPQVLGEAGGGGGCGGGEVDGRCWW